MSLDYTREQLYRAVCTLVGPGRLQDRLSLANSTMLVRLRMAAGTILKTGDDPNFDDPALEQRLIELLDRLPDDATIKLMSDEDATGVARAIVELFYDACRARLPLPPPPP